MGHATPRAAAVAAVALMTCAAMAHGELPPLCSLHAGADGADGRVCEVLSLTSTVRMNDGHHIPRMALGVYKAVPGDETYNAVRWALDAGYRHIDTATRYANEADVGRAIRDSGVPRTELFVTTKLWDDDHGYDAALAAADASLRALGMDYVDLYLIHSPRPARRLDSWRALERLQAMGKARSIGVSNFGVHHLEELLTVARVPPAINQVELSPFLTRDDIVSFCEARGIVLEAYSPLTRARRLDDATLVGIASELGRTPAQVLLRWSLQRGFVTLPKSSKQHRIAENANVYDFELSGADMAALDALNDGFHTGWDPTSNP